MNNSTTLDHGFLALAHPARRAIVARLVAGPATVGEASHGLGISKPAVTKHLDVLEEAGVVTRTAVGRTRVLRLVPRPLDELSRWIDFHRSLWQAKFEAVERHLAETNDMEEVPE